MYIEKTIISGKYIEVLRYIDNTGKKPTKKMLNNIDEVVNLKKNNNDDWEKRNERRDIQNLKRILHTNFTDEDVFLTLTFKKKLYDETLAKKSLRNFFDRLKRKVGKDIKYVYSYGIHKKDGIHIHIVMKKVSLDLVEEIWKQDKNNPGGINKSTLRFDEEVGLYNLAKYLVSNANKYFMKYPADKKRKWSGSANLEKPIITKERIVQRNIKKDIKALKGYRVLTNKIINLKDFGIYQRVEQIKLE